MIQIKDIDFRYPGSKHLVFRDFSLELKENNIYGLLGKNGTGKSTLLYLISGLLRQQQGTVLVDGISAQDRRAEMLKDIFMVPEEFELPNVSINLYRHHKIHRPQKYCRHDMGNCVSLRRLQLLLIHHNLRLR